jgi:hypothetical protein
MKAGPWRSVEEFEAWWKENGAAFRRLSVATPPVNYETIVDPEYLRIATEIESFQRKRYLDG